MENYSGSEGVRSHIGYHCGWSQSRSTSFTKSEDREALKMHHRWSQCRLVPSSSCQKLHGTCSCHMTTWHWRRVKPNTLEALWVPWTKALEPKWLDAFPTLGPCSPNPWLAEPPCMQKYIFFWFKKKQKWKFSKQLQKVFFERKSVKKNFEKAFKIQKTKINKKLKKWKHLEFLFYTKWENQKV